MFHCVDFHGSCAISDTFVPQSLNSTLIMLNQFGVWSLLTCGVLYSSLDWGDSPLVIEEWVPDEWAQSAPVEVCGYTGL